MGSDVPDGRLRDLDPGRLVAPAAVLAAAAVVGSLHLLSRTYPPGIGGLFLYMGQAVAANGFVPPATLDGYTTVRLPFAYPPLGPYVLAVFLALGVPPLTLALVLPPVLLALAGLAAYAFGVEVFRSRTAGAVAGILLVTHPRVLAQHIDASGMVHSLALVFLVAGMAAAHRTIRRRSPTWMVVAGGLFGLTVLTHPINALLFVLGVVALFATAARDPEGFGLAAGIGAVGAVVSAPWWVRVAVLYGPETLLSASGSHGGLAVDAGAAVGLLTGTHATPAELVWPVAAAAGAGYLLRTRAAFLPAWAGVYALVFRHGPTLSALLCLLAAPAVAVLLRARPHLDPARGGPAFTPSITADVPLSRLAGAGAAALVVVTAVLAGGAYAHAGPAGGAKWSNLGDADMQAMAWLAAETPPDAAVLDPSGTMEWFPPVTGRRLAVSTWGSEWAPPERRATQKDLYRASRRCSEAECFATVLDRARTVSGSDAPHYLYVYAPYVDEESLRSSPAFEIAYARHGVVIARYVKGPPRLARGALRGHGSPRTVRRRSSVRP